MVKTSFTTATTAAVLSLSTFSSLVNAHVHEGVGFHVPHHEKRENEVYLANLRARYGEAPAKVVFEHFEKRQQTGQSSSSHASSSHASTSGGQSAGATGAATAGSAAVTMGTIPIGVTTTPETTSPLPTTYAAGATGPVTGAPTLPSGECHYIISFSP